MFKRILIWGFTILVVLILAAVIIVETTYDKNYDKEYPPRQIAVDITPERVERGKYLVTGPAHCAHCHVPMEEMPKVERGEEVDLTGGFGLEIPPGKFYAPNITPDPETGIGALSDGQLYRMLRYNINHRGEAAFDFMPFTNMTEEDIFSIIAYLRQTKPVRSESQAVQLSFLGKLSHVTGAVKPSNPDNDIPQNIEPSVSKEYGRYLAYAVANCRGCHTNRDMKTMEYIGEPYAGGLQFGPDNQTGDYVYITPNLTPDPETGIMASWDEKTFIKRMRTGRVHATSPMPWGAFKQMNDQDLKAIYLYLNSLEPIKNKVAYTALKEDELQASR